MEKLIYSTRSVNLTVSQTSDEPIIQQFFISIFLSPNIYQNYLCVVKSRRACSFVKNVPIKCIGYSK